jgi:hypothetical protein
MVSQNLDLQLFPAILQGLMLKTICTYQCYIIVAVIFIDEETGEKNYIPAPSH